MYVLGISEIDNDAGAVLLKDTEVVCAANEERFSRVKGHQGFPHLAIDWILSNTGLSLSEIDHIAIAKADPESDRERFYRVSEFLKNHDYLSKSDRASLPTRALNLLVNHYRTAPRSIALARRMDDEIRRWIDKTSCKDRTVRVPHHLAHAACAYWGSGFSDALAVTFDGQGEGVSSQIYLVTAGRFALLKEIRLPNSLGTFYASITKALGFTPARHEGKITGLAAYGKPSPALLNEIRNLAFNDAEGSFAAPAVYGSYPRILYLARRHGREDMSAAFQTVLEEVATTFIAHYVRKHEVANVVLAGGVAANVKLNQRVHEIDGVRNLFVFPHMGDGGLGYGAAQVVAREKLHDSSPRRISNVYWGPEYSNEVIESELKHHGLAYHVSQEVESEVAELIAANKVVAHFDGRMEFGPRALGNRSILYPATNPEVNQWLNAQLDRSEFMPFAPVTLAERAGDYYRNTNGATATAEFMTITFDCTERMKLESPAVVHVDGTARPQLIREEVNPRYYGILNEYFKRTGFASIVNTSFNKHEEPIVCSPDDAIRSFLGGKLDCLAIGNCIVPRPGQ